jgi:hypothetical protein
MTEPLTITLERACWLLRQASSHIPNNGALVAEIAAFVAMHEDQPQPEHEEPERPKDFGLHQGTPSHDNPLGFSAVDLRYLKAKEIREQYLANYPKVAKAWEKGQVIGRLIDDHVEPIETTEQLEAAVRRVAKAHIMRLRGTDQYGRRVTQAEGEPMRIDPTLDHVPLEIYPSIDPAKSDHWFTSVDSFQLPAPSGHLVVGADMPSMRNPQLKVIGRVDPGAEPLAAILKIVGDQLHEFRQTRDYERTFECVIGSMSMEIKPTPRGPVGPVSAHDKRWYPNTDLVVEHSEPTMGNPLGQKAVHLGDIYTAGDLCADGRCGYVGPHVHTRPTQENPCPDPDASRMSPKAASSQTSAPSTPIATAVARSLRAPVHGRPVASLGGAHPYFGNGD